MKFIIKAIGGGKYNFDNPRVIEIVSCCTRHAVDDANVQYKRLVFYSIKPHIATTKECSEHRRPNNKERKVK